MAPVAVSMAQDITCPPRDALLELRWSSLLSSGRLVPPSSSHRSATLVAPASAETPTHAAPAAAAAAVAGALDPPPSKRLRVSSSTTTINTPAPLSKDEIPSTSQWNIDTDRVRRGGKHGGAAAALNATHEKACVSSTPVETAEQCRLLHLPEELLSSIVARVVASASCPGDVAGLRLSCRSMRAAVHAPATLAAASSAAVEVSLRQWCPQAHQYLMECCEAGNAPACHFLGMVSFYCLDLHERGMQLLARAAMAGHAPATYSLAVMHFNASGPLAAHPRDLPTAVLMCMRAASACYVPAVRELAHCFQDGFGVLQDPLNAHHLLAQANLLEASQRAAAAAAEAAATTTSAPASALASAARGAAAPSVQGSGASGSASGSACCAVAAAAAPVAASTATRALLAEMAGAGKMAEKIRPSAAVPVQTELGKGHAGSPEPKLWRSPGDDRPSHAHCSDMAPAGPCVDDARGERLQGQGSTRPDGSLSGWTGREEEWEGHMEVAQEDEEVEEVEEEWLRGGEWDLLGSPTSSELLELQAAEESSPTDATHRFLVDWHAAVSGVRLSAAEATVAAEAATLAALAEMPTAESRPDPYHSSPLFSSRLHSLLPLQACSSPMCGLKESRLGEFRCCAACGEARYCSRACQAEDWASGHQVACTMLAAAVMAVAQSEGAPLGMSGMVG
ncbi:hypothetical protein CLOM_g3101 [Closterium sp. NIES-68]|nr:hypothetical protein CLOM_g3101 [Closterium sp. NIES-68]